MRSLGNDLKKRGIHAAVLFSLDPDKPDPNFIYITNANVLGIAVQTPSYTKVFVAEMEMEKVKGRSDLRVEVLRRDSLQKELNSIKKRTRRKLCVGCDYSQASHSHVRVIQESSGALMKDIKEMCENRRKIKSPKELGLMRKACRLTDRIFRSICTEIQKGNLRTEAQVKAAIVHDILRMGCTPAFDPLVASGKNASIPHHVATSRRLKRGFLIIDMGVRYKEYCSDMTRTVFIGTPTARERERYIHVKEVQKRVVDMATPGAQLGVLDDEARQKLGDYPHALGHGIGLCAHEIPRIARGCTTKVEKGMTIAIEPGMYKEGSFGIRIEDTVHIADRPERLTRTTRELITIQ